MDFIIWIVILMTLLATMFVVYQLISDRVTQDYTDRGDIQTIGWVGINMVYCTTHGTDPETIAAEKFKATKAIEKYRHRKDTNED